MEGIDYNTTNRLLKEDSWACFPVSVKSHGFMVYNYRYFIKLMLLY